MIFPMYDPAKVTDLSANFGQTIQTRPVAAGPLLWNGVSWFVADGEPSRHSATAAALAVGGSLAAAPGVATKRNLVLRIYIASDTNSLVDVQDSANVIATLGVGPGFTAVFDPPFGYLWGTAAGAVVYNRGAGAIANIRVSSLYYQF